MIEEPIPRLIDNTCGHGGCEGAGTYTLPGRCSNCGREYQVKNTKGHDKPYGFFGVTCPNCGCRKVTC
jgi:DNA-directed RNA polymerase subunit RPC12/RpoP